MSRFTRAILTVCATLAALRAPPVEAAERYPVGPGMRWTYRQVRSEREPVEVSVEVSESLGEGIFRLRSTEDEKGNLVQVEGGKVYSVFIGPAGSIRTLVLDFTRAEGEAWEIPCQGEVLVESTVERVETPAGAFEGCWRVRTQIRCLPGLAPARVWYAPGIGRVKTEFADLIGSAVEELVAFEPLGSFIRGDTNGDGDVDLSDAVTTLGWLFLGGDAPLCIESADADGDTKATITDAIYLLQHLFLSGPRPPPPFPACARTDFYSLPCTPPGACGQ